MPTEEFSPFPGIHPPVDTEADYPIRHVLPGEQGAYTQNWVAYWVLHPWETQATYVIDELANFYERYMSPLTCHAHVLDWLAQLGGYTGIYWDTHWPERAKRLLIHQAHVRVWPTHGSLDLLLWLLQDVFALPAVIQTGNESFRADVNRTGEALGGESSVYHVLMADTSSRFIQWALAERILKLWAPIWIPYTVSYESFRCDRSQCGEILTA